MNTDLNFSCLGGLGGSCRRDGPNFGGLRGNGGRGGSGLGSLEKNNMRAVDKVCGLGRGGGEKYGGRGGFGGHNGQPYGRDSIVLGKRNHGDDCIGESSSKRWKEISERDGDLGRSGSAIIPNSFRGRGGYIRPDSSRVGGFGRYNDAKNSQHGAVSGWYNEPNNFRGIGGSDAVEEDRPQTYDNREVNRIVSPWEHDSRERSHLPLHYSMPDHDWARLAGRPVDHALPDQDRFPYPPFRSAQPLTDNRPREPFLPAPHKTPHQTQLFSNPINTIKADPKSFPPLVGLGASRIPFPASPMHQNNFGLSQTQPRSERPIPLMDVHPQIERPMQPMSPQSQYGRPIKQFQTTSLNNIKNTQRTYPDRKSALGSSRAIRDQTFSPKPVHTRNPRSESDSRYRHYSSNIFNTMVDFRFVETSSRTNAKLFATTTKRFIGKRLRKLTGNDPFNKDLISIYRQSFPHSTDEGTLKSVSKQLSLPNIPIPIKVHLMGSINDTGLSHIQVNDFSHLAKYVDLNLKADAESKVSMEENVKGDSLLLTKAAIIPKLKNKDEDDALSTGSTKIKLQINAANFLANQMVYGRMLTLEERKQLTRPQNLLLVKLPALIQKRLNGIPYESPAGVHTYEHICAAYRRHFPASKDAAWLRLVVKKLELTESLHTLDPELTKEDDGVKQDSKQQSKGTNDPDKGASVGTLGGWREACVLQVAYEALHGRILDREQLSEDQQAKITLARTIVREQVDKVIESTNGAVTTLKELYRLYRERHPTEEDASLKGLVMHKAATNPISESKLDGWREVCVCQVTDEMLYGRVLSRKQRDMLKEEEQEKVKVARAAVREQLKEIIEGIKLHKYEAVSTHRDLHRRYRELHPPEEDAALKECVTRKAAANAKEWRSDPTKIEKIADSKVAGWRDSVTWQVADEALFGNVLNATKRKTLAKDEQLKARLAREVVHEQLEQIIARERTELHLRNDLHQLYRKLHPKEKDADLKALATRKAEGLKAEQM